MKIQPLDFRFELAKSNHRELLQQWCMQKHVQEILNKLKLKKISSHLEEFFDGKYQYNAYWIGYFKNDPFAFLIGSYEKNNLFTLDAVVCENNYLEKGLLIPLLHEFRCQHINGI